MNGDIVFHSCCFLGRDHNIDSNVDGDSGSDEDPDFPKEPTYYVHIFGKSEIGESVHVQVKFPPFAFMEISKSWTHIQVKQFIKDLPSYLKKQMSVDDCKLVYRKKFYGFTNNTDYKFIRLMFRTHKGMRNFDAYAKERGHSMYESNVDPILKLFHVQDLEASGWLQISKGKYKQGEKTTWCTHNYVCMWNDLVSLPDKTTVVPLVVASFDIEVMSVDDSFPDPDIEGNDVIQIATTLTRHGEKEPFLKHLINLGHSNPIGDDVQLVCCDTEIGVLNAWRKLLIEHHVDIILGYNIWGFDLSFMYKRAIYNDPGCDFMNLGKFRDEPSVMKKTILSSAAYGHNEFQILQTPGILQIDLMHVIRKEHKLESYSLNKVSEVFLGEHKIDMPAKELFRLWRIGDPESKKLIGEYCFCQGTRVSLPSCSVDITCLQDSDSDVVTWVEDKGFSTSQKIHFFSNGERDCIELTLVDGTKIRCTKNHRFLTNNGWVEAEHLQPVDKIIYYPEQPFIDYETEKSYTFEFSELTGEMSFDKACIFCRILGYLLTDGGISDSSCYKNYLSGRIKYTYTMSYINLGTKIDAETMQKDILYLVGKSPTIKKDIYTYRIVLPMELTKWFLSLEGVEKGKRLNLPIKLPGFITNENCPLWIIREFIKGLMGGDGGCPCFSEQDNKFSNVTFCQSKTKGHLESLDSYLRHLQILFEKFDIHTIISNISKNTKGDGYTQNLKIRQSDMVSFYEKIGYAYCIGKTYKLAVVSSYFKLKRETGRQFDWVRDRTNMLIKNTGLSRIEAVNQSHLELKTNEPIFNNYYSLPGVLMTRKVLKTRGKYNFHKKNFPSAKEYLLLTESYDKFTTIDNKKSHAVQQDAIYSPCYYLSVLHKKDIGKRPVYDIEVKDTHNFVANGAVVHNCVQDTALPAKILIKLGILSNMIEMSKATHVPMEWLLPRGQQIKCFSQILKYIRKRSMLCPATSFGERKVEKFEGATVLPPLRGAYVNDIVSCLDFASLYPSIMRAENLCHSTLVVDKQFDDLEGVEYGEYKTDTKTYRFVQNIPGVLPELLEDLAKFRKKAKKEMAEAKKRGDDFMYNVYNGKQLAYKVSMNSVYGFTGAANGFLPCVPIASAVTATGRKMIEHTKEMVEREYPGSQVIYGDTVSCDLLYRLIILSKFTFVLVLTCCSWFTGFRLLSFRKTSRYARNIQGRRGSSTTGDQDLQVSQRTRIREMLFTASLVC